MVGVLGGVGIVFCEDSGCAPLPSVGLEAEVPWCTQSTEVAVVVAVGFEEACDRNQ